MSSVNTLQQAKGRANFCSPQGSQLRCLDFQLFTLCSLYFRCHFKAFHRQRHATGFPSRYWQCPLLLRRPGPLLTLPQTCAPKPAHPWAETTDPMPRMGVGGRVSPLPRDQAPVCLPGRGLAQDTGRENQMGPSWKNSRPSAGLAPNKEEGAQGSRLGPPGFCFLSCFN